MTQANLITINITKIVQAKDKGGNETRKAYQNLKNQVEPSFLAELLQHTEGNKAHAARICGIDRSTLGKRLKQHNICADSADENNEVKA